MNVLLPAPFSPSRPCTSPASASKSTSFSATMPPKSLLTFRASRSAIHAPAEPRDDLRAALGDEDDLLPPAAGPCGRPAVDTRLDGEHHARPDLALVVRHESRLLVHARAHLVA